MSIQDWAAIGEIIGGIAVVVTLIYLAVQIRDSNRETRAAALRAALTSENELNSAFVEYADTWDKVVTGASLSEGKELRRAIVLFNMLMADTEIRFHEYNGGYLDRASWESRRSTLPYNVRMPIFKIWRDSIGARSRSAEFLAFLDEEAGKNRH